MADQDTRRAECETSKAIAASNAAAQTRATEASEARRIHDALEDDDVAEALKLLHLRSKD